MAVQKDTLYFFPFAQGVQCEKILLAGGATYETSCVPGVHFTKQGGPGEVHFIVTVVLPILCMYCVILSLLQVLFLQIFSNQEITRQF